MPRGRKAMVPTDMPPMEEAQGTQRETLALWMKERFEKMELEHQQRVDILRNGGEHPSPIFSKMVKNFGALGLPKNLVAKMMEITPGTLNQFYADDYDLGAAEVISSVAANMIRIGTSTEDPNAAKVGLEILNRRGGEEWKPPAQKLDVSDARDKPKMIDSSKFTYEERQQMRAMLQRVAEGGEGDPVEPGEEDGVVIP